MSSQREFFIDNLLVRIHFFIVMIRWTGLAPWEFEFLFSGSLTSTFLAPGSTGGSSSWLARTSASERRENNVKHFRDICLIARAVIWPWRSHMCHVRSTFSSVGAVEDFPGVNRWIKFMQTFVVYLQRFWYKSSLLLWIPNLVCCYESCLLLWNANGC